MSEYKSEQEARADYWSDIKSMAEYCIRAEKEGQDLSDAIHESVDGSQWIIYTWRNLLVLQHCGTDSEDAAWDDGKPEANSFGELMQVIAFYAMRRDLETEVQEQKDAAPEEADAT